MPCGLWDPGGGLGLQRAPVGFLGALGAGGWAGVRVRLFRAGVGVLRLRGWGIGGGAFALDVRGWIGEFEVGRAEILKSDVRI